MIIEYCAGCNERISQKELDRGEAVIHRGRTYCSKCRETELAGVELDDSGTSRKAKEKKPARQSTVMLQAGELTAQLNARSDSRRSPATRRAPSRRASGLNRAVGNDAGPSKLPLALAGAGLVVVVVCAALMWNSEPGGGGRGSSTSSSISGAVLPSDDGSSAAASSKQAALQSELDELRGWLRSNPGAHKANVERWEALAQRTAGTSLEAVVSSELMSARNTLDTMAGRMFDSLDQRASRHVVQGEFKRAKEVWEAFDPRLLSETWKSKVDREIKQLEADLARLAPGEIPQGLAAADLRLDRSLSGWVVNMFDRPNFVGDGELSFAGLSYTPHVAMGDQRHLFGDYHLQAEIKLSEAGCIGEILPRLPLDVASPSPVIRLESTDKGIQIGSWYRLHIVGHGRKLTYWVEGLFGAREVPCELEQGMLGFRATGGRLHLRNPTLRIGSPGKPVDLSARYAAMQRIDLLAADADKGWAKLGGHGTVEVADGVGKFSAPEERQALFVSRAPSRGDFTLTYEFRRVTSRLTPLMRVALNQERQLVLTRIHVDADANPADTWTRVTVICKGERVYWHFSDRPQDCVSLRLRSARGQVAFAIDAGGSFELRNAVISAAPDEAPEVSKELPKGLLYNGKNLYGFAQQGAQDWVGKVPGVLSISCPAGSEQAMAFHELSTGWGDYQLEFEFKGASGPVQLLMRLGSVPLADILRVPIDGARYKPDRWTKMTVVARGSKITVTTDVDGDKRELTASAATGGFGFIAAPGGALQVRNLRVKPVPAE